MYVTNRAAFTVNMAVAQIFGMKACIFDASSTHVTIAHVRAGKAPISVYIALVCGAVFIAIPPCYVLLSVTASGSDSPSFGAVDWMERMLVHVVPAFVIWAIAA